MNFSDALVELKNGVALTRAGWNGKDLSVKAQFPDAEKSLEPSMMGSPFFLIGTPEGKKQFWVPSVSDIFAEDWATVGEAK